VLLCSSIITGCSANESSDEDAEVASKLENPFDMEQMESEVEGKEVVGNYGFGIAGDRQELIFDGEYVDIPVEWQNFAKAIDVGIMLFVDGEPQEIFLKGEESESKTYLKKITLPEEKLITKTISFRPSVGRKGDKLKVHVTSMLNPSYLPTGEKETFDVQHSLLDVNPIDLEYKVDAECRDLNTAVVESEFMTDEDRLSLKIDDDQTNQVLLHSKGESRYENRSFKMKNDDKYLNLQLSAYGDELFEFKTTVFVNHEPIKTKFAGYDVDNYIFSIQKDYLSTADISVDKKYMDADQNIIYAISVPVGENVDASWCLKEPTRVIKFGEKADSQEEKKELKEIVNKDMREVDNKEFEDNGSGEEICSNLFSIIGVSNEKYMYAISDEGKLLCLNLETREQMGSMQLSKKTTIFDKYELLDNGLAIVTKKPKSENKIICNIYDESLNLKREIDLNDLLEKEIEIDERNVCVLEDGKSLIFTDSTDKSIYICDIDSGKIDKMKSLEEKDTILNLGRIVYDHGIVGIKTSIEEGGKRNNYIGMMNDKNAEIIINEISEGEDYQVGDIQIANGLLLAHDVAVFDDKYLSGRVEIIDSEGVKKLLLLDKREGERVSLSSDGKKIATCFAPDDEKYIIRIYDIDKQKMVQEIEGKKLKERSRLYMSLQSDKLFVLYGGHLREYDVKTIMGSV
jgi:hypothetical protein